jgi:Rieske Fe-S protein
MKMNMRAINRYIEDLISSRRPRRFRAGRDDAELARTAITLRASRPGSGEPAEEFVTALHKQLAAELDPPPARRVAGARRTFLRAATATGAIAVAGAAGAGIDHELTARTAAGQASAVPSPPSTLTPGNGSWMTVAASRDLPDGAVRPFIAGPIVGFIHRTDGQLRAVSGICTHQGCRLALDTHPARLACPCHGATFTLDGVVLSHRFPVPLAALPQVQVREADGSIQVYAPATV